MAWRAMLLAALIPGWAAAHPIDEVVQGAYLTLAPGEVRLELDLTPGAEVSPTVLAALDANGDRAISKAEARRFAQRVLDQTTLTLDGKAAPWRIAKVDAPPYQNLLQATDTLKIYAIARRPDRAGAHTLYFDNRYQPAKSQCIANIFLQPGRGWRFFVAGQQRSNDGRRLTVRYVGARL
jgi:hypothetical protein